MPSNKKAITASPIGCICAGDTGVRLVGRSLDKGVDGTPLFSDFMVYTWNGYGSQTNPDVMLHVIVGRKWLEKRDQIIIRSDSDLGYPDAPRVVIFPSSRELRQQDPRGKLRRYAKANKLMIARVFQPCATPIYRLVDPLRGYIEVAYQVQRQIEYPFRFSSGSFYNTIEARTQQKEMIVLPGPKGYQINIPPSFKSVG